MKTSYTLSEIKSFLKTRMSINSDSLAKLTEGHSSQVVSFKTDDRQLVIRIREDEQDLLADQYAYQHFGHDLPIPKVIEVGRFDSRSFYCISDFIEGPTALSLGPSEFSLVLPKIQDALACTFHVDITKTRGYGDIDVATGEGGYSSYKSSLTAELAQLGVGRLHEHARNINIEAKIVDALVSQFESNLPYVSEVRRLTHGDPGEDNMIIKDGAIRATIDWEQMAYADWMRDFSRFEYYRDSRYGDANTFAKQYGLEADNLKERRATYWAINALRDIEFASSQRSEEVAQRLRKEIKQKLLLV